MHRPQYRLIDTCYWVVHAIHVPLYYQYLPLCRFASYCVGFEVLTAVVKKTPIFWDITPCSPLRVNRRFGEPCHLNLQGRTSQAKNQHEAGSKQLWLLPGNVGSLSVDYKASHLRREENSSASCCARSTQRYSLSALSPGWRVWLGSDTRFRYDFLRPQSSFNSW
jgi:hypothetical protein